MADEQAKPAGGTDGDKKKHLKISQMSLDQVKKALENAQKTMGGTHSHYAQALISRQQLLSAAPASKKK